MSTSKRGRPLRGAEKRKKVSFTIEPAAERWLSAEARSHGVSKSDVLARIIDTQRLGRAAIDSGDAFVKLAVQQLVSQVEAFCRKHQIQRLSLFGSAAKNQLRPESDIDLLVEFEPGATVSLLDMARMEQELGIILPGRRIDLKTPADLSRYFRQEVVKEARPIYG